MFIVKKILTLFFMPLSLYLEIMFIGILLLWTRKNRGAGRFIVSAGVIILTVLSFHFVSDTLLRHFEDRYPALVPGSSTLEIIRDGKMDIKWIVVLGGGHKPNPHLPVSGRLSSTTLERLVEGIRLHRLIPEAKLLLSGGSAYGSTTDAGMMAEVAEALGVNSEDLVLESFSKQTEDQAQLIQTIVQKDRFILVTSAIHMPRAIALFANLGMDPISAPTDDLMGGSEIRPALFYPSYEALGGTTKALYEYWGTIWGKLRRKI